MKLFARAVDVFVFVSLSFLLTTALAVCIDPPTDSLKVEQELSGLRSLVGEQLQTLEFKPEVYRLDYRPGDELQVHDLRFVEEGGR